MTDNSLLRLTGKRFRAGAYDKVVLPVGSTEYHGDHLPYGTDSLVAESLARAVSERVKGMLLLPTMPFGMSRHYASFPSSDNPVERDADWVPQGGLRLPRQTRAQEAPDHQRPRREHRGD